MTDAPSTPRWTAATALLAAVLWVAQLAAGWEPPHRAGESFQQGEAGLTHVIESQIEASFRAKAPEAPSEPKALPGSGTSSQLGGASRAPGLTTGAGLADSRPHARPAIRAPPHDFFSV